MPILENFLTEHELADQLKDRCGFGKIRMLRTWRARRIGPPWARLGRKIIYPCDGFEEWLRNQVQHPVDRSRSRKRSVA